MYTATARAGNELAARRRHPSARRRRLGAADDLSRDAGRIGGADGPEDGHDADVRERHDDADDGADGRDEHTAGGDHLAGGDGGDGGGADGGRGGGAAAAGGAGREPEGRVRAIVGKVRGHGLARDSIWGMSLEGVSLVSTILVFSLLGRSLGPTDYGAYVSVFALVNPMVTLTASGVSLALMEHAVRRQEPLDQVARSSLTMSLLLGSFLSVVGVLLALGIVEEITPLAAITIVIGEFLVAPLGMIAASTLQSGSSFRDATKVRLATTLARTAVVVTLYAIGHLTVLVYVLTNVGVLLLVSLVALRVVGRKFGFRFVPGRFRMPMLKTNGTYSVAISAYSFQNDGEKMVMTANNLTTDTGLYTAAYRVAMMGMVPVGAFMSASHTRILEQVEGERGHHLRLSAKYAAILGAYGLVVSVAVFFAAPMLPLLVGDKFQDSVEMMRWLAPIIFLRSIGATPVNGLLGLGRMGVRTLVIVGVSAVSMVLYLTMIPVWGWKGAIAATMIGEVLNVVTAWGALWIFQRRHDRELDARTTAPETSLETMP